MQWDQAIATRYPIIMKDVRRYAAHATRAELLSYRRAELVKSEGSVSTLGLEAVNRNLTSANTETYCYRPFDIRWLYYEHNTKLLDEKRSDYWNAHKRVPAIISAKANRRSFDPPVVTRSLSSYHVIERASLIIPLCYDMQTAPGLIDVMVNLKPELWDQSDKKTSHDNFFF